MTHPLALLVVAALAVPTAAQVTTPFWADEHLDGYVDAANSKHHSLYRLEEFEKLNGKRLGTKARYEELKVRWMAEQNRVAVEIRELEADPSWQFLFGLDARLARHTYFRNLEFERVARHAPVHFYVHEVPGAREGLGNFVSNEYGPWLAAFDRLFEEEYVEPEKLEPGRDTGAVVVFVLASSGDYSNYATKIGNPGLANSLAHYDLDLEIAVIYDDTHSSPFGSMGPHERRRPVLHEMAHRLQHIWYTGPGDFAPQMWFAEGFADYFSFHLSHTPAGLAKHPIDTEALKLFTPHAERDSPYALPVAELFAAQSYADALQAMAKRSGGRFDPGLGMAMFYAHSNLLMHYLHHGLPEGHEDVGRRYVAAALRGRGGLLDLKRLLGDLTVEQLEEGFVDYLTANMDGYLDRRRAGVAEASTPAAKTASTPPTFDPTALAIPAADAECAFALALLEASEGRYGQALEALDAVASGADGDLKKRMELERERLVGVRTVMQQFLLHARAINKRIPLTLDGGRVNARVKEVSDGGVVLESVKIEGKRRRFEFDELDPRELCMLMDERKYEFSGSSPMRGYPFLFEGEVPAEVRKRIGGADDLWRDAVHDYPSRLQQASAARGLNALAAAVAPESRAAADEALALIATLTTMSELSLVKERSAPLRSLATLALWQVFEDEGLGCALHAPVEQLEDNRVRITYDFTDTAQLADFSPERDENMASFMSEQELEETLFEIDDGTLIASEDAFLRHRLKIEAPYRIHCKVRLPDGEQPFALIGCWNPGQNEFQATDVFGTLLCLDSRRGMQTQPSQTPPKSRKYGLEIRHDGDREVASKVGRKDAGKLRAPAVGGEIFLWSHSMAELELSELVMEGGVSDTGRAMLRDHWVAERLRALGLE